MKLAFAAEAKLDLLRIGDWIARDNPRRAVTFIEEIEARCRSLPAMPKAYQLMPRHEASGIRRIVHGNYLIFYRIEEKSVVVLRILHGAMDYERLLFPDR
jgi:addiction module RelE/StbE family toxin